MLSMRSWASRVTASAAGTGRAITDTQYNGIGQTAKITSLFNSAAPATGLAGFDDKDVNVRQRYVYDNLGRQTRTQQWTGNTTTLNMLWQTITGYDGDKTVTVTPPPGGTPSQDVFDARGQLVEKRLYQSASAMSGVQVENVYNHHCLRPASTALDAQVDPANCDPNSTLDDWTLDRLTDGNYRLRNVSTGYCLVAFQLDQPKPHPNRMRPSPTNGGSS
jgi:hypothetical protein